MKNKIIRVFFLTSILLWGGSAPAMDLVRDGAAKAMIVIPDKPLGVETAAAEELHYHILKATGANLQILKETTALSDGAKIFLGATRAAAKAGLRLKDATPNAFITKLVGDSLFILGDDTDGPVFGVQQNNRTRVGTLFGVYEFLQRQMDVLWLWPGELGEVIPATRNITVNNWNHTGHPPFVHTRWRDAGLMAGQDGWDSPEARAKYLYKQSVWLRRHRFAMSITMDMDPLLHQLVGQVF